LSKIRIILADDHVVVRQGLRSLIDQQKDLLVVGEADDGLQLLESVGKLRPDVALVDLKMPNLNGIDAAEEIRRRFPNTHVVILTMHADRSYIERAMQAGVAGYVLKEENIGEMCTAIRHAARGNRYLSSGVSGQVHGSMDEGKIHLNSMPQLTIRERQVFQLVAEGKTSGEIARLLNISVRTVEGHRAHMMAKLNLKTHVDFVRFALKHGIFVEK
jgi:two-component system, NarL family, response regulator NreC